MILDTEKQLEKILFDKDQPFFSRAYRVFNYQSASNPVYKSFLNALGTNSKKITGPEDIPLLPIRAFKYKRIVSGNQSYSLVFKSSGTSLMAKSEHAVPKPNLYKRAISNEFYTHFTENEHVIVAFMPGYSENPQSSLIWMAKYLINRDKSGMSTFIESKDEHTDIFLHTITKSGKKLVLFGAAFGLLDMIKEHKIKLPEGSEIVETGGMKTYQREISKSELRKRLSSGFGVPYNKIHSEYGMCELLSQMYAIGGEWFTSPHWVHVTIRNHNDPMKICDRGEEGKIGIIDLANLYSCSFILTEDRGVMDSNGRFKVLGRWNEGNMRGCNFLFEQD